MYDLKTSKKYVRAGDLVFDRDDISVLDCSEIEELKIKITLKSGLEIKAEDIHALELIMQVKPSMLESKRLRWPKFAWFIHNVFGHPLTQFFALFKCYKLAFWIHDVTVPKPLGKRIKKDIQ